MGKNRGETPKDEGEATSPDARVWRRGDRTRGAAGTGSGLAKAEYDEATEEAVEDIHG